MSPSREPIIVQRPVRAQQVPSGRMYELQAGMPGYLTQSLGGSYTVFVEGALWRIDGSDGDAIGQPVHEAATWPEHPSDAELQSWVWEELGDVYDPEIPCSIVDLGLVYRCEFTKTDDEQVDVDIDMTLTAPGCGMGEQLANEVADRVLALPRVGCVHVNVVFDPPWDRSMMTEAARLALGML